MKITEIKIRKLIENDSVKAIVSIVIDDVFAVHDMKIIEKKDSGDLFVAMPYRKTSTGKQLDIAHPINVQTRKEIEDAIIAKYYETLKAKSEEKAEEE